MSVLMIIITQLSVVQVFVFELEIRLDRLREEYTFEYKQLLRQLDLEDRLQYCSIQFFPRKLPLDFTKFNTGWFKLFLVVTNFPVTLLTAPRMY